jgi:hypothetical protein
MNIDDAETRAIVSQESVSARFREPVSPSFRGSAMRHLIAALAVVALPLVAGCSGWNLKTAREERNLTVTLGAGRAIRVDAVNGSVSIVADSSLSLVAIKADVRGAARTEEEARARLAEIGVVAENVDGGDLSISLVFPDGRARNNEGCDFEIRTPGANGVSVSTGNGPIRIEGLAGLADLRTSNGAVTVVRHDGAVRVDTSNGPITIDDALGDAELVSSNGRITVNGARKGVKAKTSNGRIEFSAADGYASPFDLDTSNGSVNVFLPESASVDVSARTSNGDISTRGGAMNVSGDKKSKRIRVGEGTEPSRIDTSNGEVLVAIEPKPEAERPQ